MKRSIVIVAAVIALVPLVTPSDAQSATRRSQFAAVCRGHTATQACDRFLAPLACSKANPLQRGPFSCAYFLGVHPCHADPGSTSCQLFLDNYCFERPDGVGCFYFRANPGMCSLVAAAAITRPSSTCALFKPDMDCPIVQPDGGPPRSPECQLYAAAFLDYCQQRAQSGACNNPYGGAQETLSFVVKTRPCPRKQRRRHRVCRALAAADTRANTDAGLASPWPFTTITYYVGQTSPDGSIHPAPRRWTSAFSAAFQAWNAVHVGWRLRRAASPRIGDADVVALAAPRGKSCVGVSTRGFGYGQARLAVGGRCLERGVLELAAAHEIGHLLGLGHETRTCSVMNSGFTVVGNSPRPSRCGAGSPYRSGLVQASDVRRARDLRHRPVGASRACDPVGELPVFAHDFACKYDVTCAGANGRNLFAEPGTTVIDAEIAARCRRVLRVTPVGEPPPVAAPADALHASGGFVGTSSQGKRVSLRLRDGVVRDLTVDAHFTCTDNTRQFSNSIRAPTPSIDELGLLRQIGVKVVDRRVNGDETIGPFPPLATTRHGFEASLAPPNASTIYEVRGSLRGASWTGSVRIVEGWHDSLLGPIPDPDGELVCDTGAVGFTTRRAR